MENIHNDEAQKLNLREQMGDEAYEEMVERLNSELFEFHVY